MSKEEIENWMWAPAPSSVYGVGVMGLILYILFTPWSEIKF